MDTAKCRLGHVSVSSLKKNALASIECTYFSPIEETESKLTVFQMTTLPCERQLCGLKTLNNLLFVLEVGCGKDEKKKGWLCTVALEKKNKKKTLNYRQMLQ